jgi:O-antigen ligase
MWGLGSSMLVAASTFLAMGFASRIFNTMKVMNEGQNVSSRSDIWRVHFAIFQDFPVLGAGNNWMQAGIREQYYSKMIEPQLFPNFKSLLAHNLYLQILCDVGVVGAVAVVCLVAYGAWLLWKQLRGKFVARTVGVAFALAFAANLVHGVTENTYFASNISLVTLFLLLVVIWTSIFEGREGTGGGA